MARFMTGLRVAAIALMALGIVFCRLAAAQDALPPYDAKAGMLNIGLSPETPDAEIFHISYIAKGMDPQTRPVTFVFNGGPGAASIFLHMAAISPKIIVSPGDGSFPASPARLQDNPDSWIGFTDLVFIDPVGTGYSRMLPGPDGAPRDPKPYYTVESDLNAIAIFIQKWLTQNNRWSSPKAIAGESYGGKRVIALTKRLAERYAINVNRAVMISPEMNVSLSDANYALVWPMSLLPTQAAVAAYHGLNSIGTDPNALKAVEDYALNGYLTSLANLGRMDAKSQDEFYAKVSSLIGIDKALVARHRGRIFEGMFAANLLRAKGQILDPYDGTQASDNPTPAMENLGVFPRTVSVLTGVLLPPFMDYVRNDLGYETDRPYIPLSLEVSGLWQRESPLGGPDDLAVALAQNEGLKALVVHGYHDIQANYFLSRYLLEQSTLAAGARERLFFGTYFGGHMFYLRSKSRAEFTQDVREFFKPGP